MKILDNKQKTWSLKLKCKDCKSKLEICAADVYFEYLGSFDGYNYYSVDCGACGRQIDVGKRVPSWVIAGAKKKS